MGLVNTLNYDNSSNFNVDTNKITIAADARLKLKIEAGDFIEDFADDTGFTYDNTKAEFVAGKLQGKDNTPTNSQLGATYTSVLDANWRKDAGSLTATLTGVPTLAGGYLDCTANQGVAYSYTTNSIETHKFIYKPNYNTSPSNNANIIGSWNGTDNKDKFYLMAGGSGGWRVHLYNSTGTQIFGLTIITPPTFTLGTDIEVEIVLDSVAGTFRVFADGVLMSTLTPGAWTRGGISSDIKIGNGIVYSISEASFDKYLYFTDAQHTATYTPGYTVLETIYEESSAIAPEMMHTGLGTVTEFNTFTTVETGAPRYTIQVGRSGVYVYYNGIAWISSDGTYAQANDQTTFNANVSTLNIGGELYGQFKIHLPDSNTQATIDTLTANVSGETTYPVDNPGVIPNTSFVSDGLVSFVENSTVSGSDLVKYHIDISGVHMYWDGVAWSVSNGTYAQSNTAAEVNTNAASLDLGSGKSIKIHAYLHSGDGSTTPILTSTTTTYSFAVPTATPALKCVVFGYVRELTGDAHPSAIQLVITNESVFYYNGVITVGPNVKTASADSLGNVDISVIETATPGTYYKFQLKYINYLGKSQTVDLGNAMVPNQETVNIATLTFI